MCMNSGDRQLRTGTQSCQGYRPLPLHYLIILTSLSSWFKMQLEHRPSHLYFWQEDGERSKGRGYMPIAILKDFLAALHLISQNLVTWYIQLPGRLENVVFFSGCSVAQEEGRLNIGQELAFSSTGLTSASECPLCTLESTHLLEQDYLTVLSLPLD